MALVSGAPVARLAIAAVASLGAAALSAARAQQALPTAPGFGAREQLRETGHPAGFAGFAPATAPDELFYAVDRAVYHLDRHGVPTLLHAFGHGARCDLLVHPPDRNTLYYADDRSGVLRVRDLGTGIETTRSLPAHTFDLDTTASGALLAAANPSWPAASARPGIWLLDPVGSAHREIVTLTGASGPLAVDRATGDLLVASASATFPTPPGSISVRRFPAAVIASAIAGGPPLDETVATVVASGLDGAFDLAIDDRDRVLVSNPIDGRVLRLDRAGRAETIVPAHGRSALGLAFVDQGPPTFDAYQPGDGGVLLVATSDWATSSTVHALRTERPAATSASGPTAGAGNLAIELTGLPPQSAFVLLFNHLPLLPAERLALRIGGVPVFVAIDLLVRPLAVPGTADASGQARLSLPYSGGLSWTLAFQAAASATSPGGTPMVVTSSPVSIRLIR